MNRTITLLLAVVVLGGVAWYATSDVNKQPAKATERSTDRQFGYAQLEDVHRIFVADRKGHQVTLTRGGITGWLADGRPANENILKNLLEPVQRMEIQSLPTRAAVPNIVKNLATQGILVQLFGADGEKLRGYYIGGGTNDERGTYAITEGSENPYVVHLPHWTGNVRHRFSHWDDEWRDKVYFRVDPDQVEYLSIEYPTQRNKSFRLERHGNHYLMHPYYESELPARKMPLGIGERILVRYEKYYVNRYENGDALAIAAAREQLPFATIRIKQTDKMEQIMALYPRYVDGEVEAYRAFINDGADWVLLNVETTEPLLVGYGSF
ncbi:MAG: hypothetical protein AAFZ52_05345 [Bacteroidota bacterium]